MYQERPDWGGIVVAVVQFVKDCFFPDSDDQGGGGSHDQDIEIEIDRNDCEVAIDIH
jgi:hypothetical protein